MNEDMWEMELRTLEGDAWYERMSELIGVVEKETLEVLEEIRNVQRRG